jgi:hypothetical protein
MRELITHDVNHPCVVMWANGNGEDFKFELLPKYTCFDIQKRSVIHPWLEEKDVNTYYIYVIWRRDGFLFREEYGLFSDRIYS